MLNNSIIAEKFSSSSLFKAAHGAAADVRYEGAAYALWYNQRRPDSTAILFLQLLM